MLQPGASRSSLPVGLVALLALALGSPLASARVFHDAPCFEACQTSLRSIRFADPGGNDTRPALRPCLSNLAASSLYLCSYEYCTISERAAGFNYVNTTCHSKLDTWLPPTSIVSNYTEDDIAALRRFEKQDLENQTVFAEIVLPSEDLYKLTHDTLAAWGYVWAKHIDYSLGLFVFWTIVIVIGLSYRATAKLGSRTSATSKWLHLDDSEDEESGDSLKPSSRSSVLRLWIKRQITIPATFGYKSSQSFGWYTVPPRVQSLTLMAFVLMNIAFCCQGYWVFEENMYWPDVRTQWLRYIADRTGIISFANFPLIWLFGMRNNLLMWLTGWDFGTYNNFHRWVARVSTVQAIIHSIAYTIQVFDRIGYTGFIAYFDQFFWWTGEVATVLMSLLLGFSMYWFRRHTYETFLIIHIGFSVIILYTMWAHVTIFNGRFNPPIWICCGIWALDRIMRMSRTLLFNPRFWSTIATATYGTDANMIRLQVPASTSFYTPRPGTFYYLHVLNDPRFWESHPFTMAKLESYIKPPSSSPDESDEEEHLLSGQQTPEDKENSYGRQNQASTMTFLIRPYDSFTGRLKDTAQSAAQQGLGSAQLRVLVEGPYGHTLPFDRFDNLVFVVGGSGIVVPLTYLSHLLPPQPPTPSEDNSHASLLSSCCSLSNAQRPRSPSNNIDTARARTRTIRIIWAVRESALADSVLRDDFPPSLLQDERLSINIYVTKAQPHSDDIALTTDPLLSDGNTAQPGPSSQASTQLHPPQNAKILHGRPLVQAEIEDFAEENTWGSLGVVACGPGVMADDARRTVVDMQGRRGSGSGAGEKSRRVVDYFEESFNW